MLTKAEREDVREFFIALYKQGGITDARYSQLLALLADLDTLDEALRGVLAAFDGALRFAARVPEMSRLTREEVDTLRRAAEALEGE